MGYDDDGNAVGIDDVDNVYTQITNTVRDSISPDITMFTKYTLQDNNTILIEVSEGTAKTYYIKSKGLCAGFSRTNTNDDKAVRRRCF